MKTKILDEVIACLADQKRHYRYFKGAYAARILELVVPEQISIRELKSSRFGCLLNQAMIKDYVAQCGNGILYRDELASLWQEPSQPFLLSISRWGKDDCRSWNQTSRYGENLVLQLNMPLEHQRQYQRWIDPSGLDTLNGIWTDHPVQKPEDNPNFRETLAWSRIDFDFDEGEALIEEVQSDGVRDVLRWEKRYKKCGCTQCKARLNYVQWFKAYSQIWSEAMLMASIEFIVNELGLTRLFLHTAQSGWKVKNMDRDWLPPRSLYSDLPKKFAFKRTYAAPEFLLKERCYQRLIRKQPDIDFYQLTVNELVESDSLGGALCQAA